MPISLRLGALLFAVASADQTVSLTQDAKKFKRDQKPLNSLLESAKGMLKSGVTPEAIDFADKILDEIQGTVLSAIVDESSQDQAMLYNRHATMKRLLNDLVEPLHEIYNHNERCHDFHESHVRCRSEQHDECYGQAPYDRDDHLKFPRDGEDFTGKRPCERELYNLHVDWVDKETLLRETHNEIHGHFCPPEANGTLYTFRVEAAPMMEQYIERKEDVERAERLFDEMRPVCITQHNELDTKTLECNRRQNEMERCQCALNHRVVTILDGFHNRYHALVEQYNNQVETFKRDEATRHHEYVTLKNVECLLARIHELNGRPCDEEGRVDEELAHCHEYAATLPVCKFNETDVRLNEDEAYRTLMDFFNPIHPTDAARSEYAYSLDHFNAHNDTHGGLCMIIPELPPLPPVCRPHSVHGHHDAVHVWNLVSGVSLYREDFPCLPGPPPKPCDSEWVAARAATPDVPQAPFAATNPGCNQYPECTVCDHDDRHDDRVHILPVFREDQYRVLPVVAD